MIECKYVNIKRITLNILLLQAHSVYVCHMCVFAYTVYMCHGYLSNYGMCHFSLPVRSGARQSWTGSEISQTLYY